MNKGDRSFTVDALYKSGSRLRKTGGRYISITPAGAAKKAFSQYYREHNIKGKITLEVHVKETTRGSSGKVFKYRVSKIQQHREVQRNGETIVYEYTTKVKSL